MPSRTRESAGCLKLENDMTEAEIERVKIGDRVKFVPLEHDAGEYSEGTITLKTSRKVEITWDDGEVYHYAAGPQSRVYLI
jgi:hypothetical protein